METWRALIPETCDPCALAHPVRHSFDNEVWVYKSALGRVGEGIGMYGVTETKEWQAIRRQVRRYPDQWVAQRRFEAVPLFAGADRWYPCIGIYTINGHAAGVYGRANQKPLIAATSKDIAVLIDNPSSV